MRAVAYARYSSDLQVPSSIEDQIRICRERIESRWLRGAAAPFVISCSRAGGSVLDDPRIKSAELAEMPIEASARDAEVASKHCHLHALRPLLRAPRHGENQASLFALGGWS
jgi:DNA invertase Pin-like site-specific DNA recombinase